MPHLAQHAAHLRLSLSGAGFLGAWHLGVGDALLRARALKAESCQIAGASAGAIVGAVLVTGTPLEHARAALSALTSQTRAAPLGMLTPGHSLVDEVRYHLDASLPRDAHRRASGQLHVALTSLRAGECGRLYYKSAFASRDELIDAVSSSSDIPGITGRMRATANASADLENGSSLWQRLTRRRDVDGGLLDLYPDPWGGQHEVVFVSPFAGVGFAVAPVRREGTLTMPEWSPVQGSKNGRLIDLSPENIVRWRHAFFPPSEEVLRAYEAEGFARCAEWLRRVGGHVGRQSDGLEFAVATSVGGGPGRPTSD